jgi:DNA repair exonuclease SbcCD ATPase subunit
MLKMEKTIERKKTTIPNKAKIRVIWEDSPENYSQERSKRIAKYISEKYNNTNVQVIFKPKKIDVEGNEIEMTVADNVMDITYQRKLFKEWVETNKVDVDWERLLRLDDKVNEKLSQQRETDYRYRNWYIKEIEWSNFLSYGDNNKISFKELEGITVITSNPLNMGGKTTLALDLLLFLFFNKTTKGNTALKMFNRFRDKNDVSVKGVIEIDGVDYIIERTVSRKLKRNGTDYTSRTDLSFHRVLPDNTIENLEGEQRRETEEFIKKSIGSVDDFLLTIIADADNLEDIIHTKPTEKGRILSRFIGLEVIEDKEGIVKEMKSSWAKGLKSDSYNITELKLEIEELEKTIEEKENTIVENELEVKSIKGSIKRAVTKKEDLISKKVEIDGEVINLRPEDIDREVEDIIEKGKKKKEEYETTKESFDKMVEPDYDEDLHKEYVKDERLANLELEKVKSKIKETEKIVKNLEEGEFCSLCKQPLADVDHSDEIKENKDLLVQLEEELTNKTETLDNLTKMVEEQDEIKSAVNEYDRTSLVVDKIELDLERLRLDRREKLDLKKRYEDNLDNIEKNKDLDSKILGYNAKIDNLELDKTNKIKLGERLENEITQHKIQIEKNKEYIKTIKAEEEIKLIFEVYQRMVGKNGIIKMIMASVMPLINSELDRLLVDTVSFKLEVDINDKKEVEFLLVRENDSGDMIKYPLNECSGFEKTVSALALRCVMSKVSCLPKPNLVVFDEIFGKVANVNLELVGNFFQKCSEMFPNIFLITHNDLVKDWSNKIITINKKSNVSSLLID